MTVPSAQAKEGKDRHDDDDETDQINDAAHGKCSFWFCGARIAKFVRRSLIGGNPG
jgi:hypothetical protein